MFYGSIACDPVAFGGHNDGHNAKSTATGGYHFIAICGVILLLSRARPLTGWAKSQKYLKVCF